MTIRAVLYARVSTGVQSEGASLETQEAMAREYCAAKGWVLSHVYVDVMTGKTDRRAQFQRLLADAKVKPRPFEYVIFYKVDRFARKARFWYEGFGVLEDAGIDIRSITQEGISNTQQGRVLLAALILAAEVEGDTITGRIKDSISHRAAAGTWVPSRPPIGFDHVPKRIDEQGRKVPGHYVLNEREAPIVRMAYEKYLELGSARAASSWLNERGYRTKQGAIFRSGSMVQLLRNPIYKGDQVFGRRVALRSGRFRRIIEQPAAKWIVRKGALPAIVDEAMWDRAQEQLERNKNTNPRLVHGLTQHTWAGLLKCAGCGGAMTRQYSKGASPAHRARGLKDYPREYYVCGTGSLGGKAACATYARISVPFLDRVVVPKVAELLRKVGGTEPPVDAAPRKARKSPPNRAQRIAELEAEQDRWNHMYGSGRVQKHAYDAKMAEIDTAKAALDDVPAPMDQTLPQLPGDLVDLWARANPHLRRQLIAPFVQRIDVDKGRCVLTLAPSRATGWPREPVELEIHRTRWASGK